MSEWHLIFVLSSSWTPGVFIHGLSSSDDRSRTNNLGVGLLVLRLVGWLVKYKVMSPVGWSRPHYQSGMAHIWVRSRSVGLTAFIWKFKSTSWNTNVLHRLHEERLHLLCGYSPYMVVSSNGVKTIMRRGGLWVFTPFYSRHYVSLKVSWGQIWDTNLWLF